MISWVFLVAMQTGFGGQAPTLESPEPACRVLDASGQWQTCTALLDAADGSAAAPEQADPEPPRTASPPAAAGSGRSQPAAEVRTTTRRPQPPPDPGGAWGEALKRIATDTPPSPLAVLRGQTADEEEALAAISAQALVPGREGQAARALEPIQKERLQAHQALLGDVEVYALRLRQQCVMARGIPFSGPALTVGKRVGFDEPEVTELLKYEDPRDCEREVLLGPTDIEFVRRLRALDKELADSANFFARRKRAAIKAEHARLVAKFSGVVGFAPMDVATANSHVLTVPETDGAFSFRRTGDR